MKIVNQPRPDLSVMGIDAIKLIEFAIDGRPEDTDSHKGVNHAH